MAESGPTTRMRDATRLRPFPFGENKRDIGAPDAGRGSLAPRSSPDHSPTGWHVAAIAALLATGIALSLLTGGGAAVVAAFFLGAAGAGGLALHWKRRSVLREKSLRAALEAAEDRAWEMSESEERYRSLAEAFGDLVMHRNAKGEILFVNRALAFLLGTEPAELVGRKFDESLLRPTENRTAMPAPAREYSINTPNGVRWLHWIDMPFRDTRSGETVTRSVARDITPHKKAEAELERARQRAESASEAKSRFLGMVSHEMRTPLNGILGMTRLLRETELTPEQASYADAVASSGGALLTLIEDLLDLSLIEAGRFELRPVETDPVQIVEEVCELLAGRAMEKGIELAACIAPQVPATIEIDAGRLRQVLVNIIGNAVKFTEKGGVSVRLLVKKEKQVNGNRNADSAISLRFVVEDTGPGISRTQQARLFREFEQADNATTRRHGGAGLGLSISRRIVRLLGGRIGVRSSPGKGSRFEFTIPAPVLRVAPAGADHALADRSVLLVSDGVVEPRLLRERILAAGGHAQIESRLGKAAQTIRSAREAGASFDAILFDPSISRDPVTSLRRLRRVAGSDGIFSVVLVEPGMRDQRDAYLGGGFDGFLVRPVRQSSLLRVLAERGPVKAEYARQTVSVAPILHKGEKLPPARILLAEDNDINALLVESVLRKVGQQVTRVSDGRQAVEHCARAFAEGAGFDLVLMDLHMPVMNGFSAIREIRKLESRLGRMPMRIFSLTADEQAGASREASKAGGNGFIVKPVDPAVLVDLLREGVAGHPHH